MSADVRFYVQEASASFAEAPARFVVRREVAGPGSADVAFCTWVKAVGRGDVVQTQDERGAGRFRSKLEAFDAVPAALVGERAAANRIGLAFSESFGSATFEPSSLAPFATCSIRPPNVREKKAQKSR